MSNKEKAKIILGQLDESAPTNINWNLEKEWISAIVKGLAIIDKREGEDETT